MSAQHTYEVQIDAKGRVTLPREILDALGLGPGQRAELAMRGEALARAVRDHAIAASAAER